MKPLSSVRILRTASLVVITAGIALAATVLAQTAREKIAGTPPPENCFVCHKNRQTLEIPCDELEYQRHIAHGDPAMPCPPSRIGREDERVKGELVAVPIETITPIKSPSTDMQAEEVSAETATRAR